MKLAIVGGGVTKDKAPYSDANYVIWSTASVGLGLPRCDAIFELHDGIFPADELNKSPAIIYMKQVTEDVPNSITFPIENLVHKYGKHFNGTVVMMLAFAYMQGYNDIELYGIDFSSDDEYSRRNQFYYMMGYLSALGVKITVCPGGYMQDTCTTYMYEDDGLTYLRQIKKGAAEQLAQDDENIKALAERKAYMRGVSDTIARFERRN